MEKTKIPFDTAIALVRQGLTAMQEQSLGSLRGSVNRQTSCTDVVALAGAHSLEEALQHLAKIGEIVGRLRDR